MMMISSALFPANSSFHHTVALVLIDDRLIVSRRVRLLVVVISIDRRPSSAACNVPF
jgi:hypothetical protein